VVEEREVLSTFSLFFLYFFSLNEKKKRKADHTKRYKKQTNKHRHLNFLNGQLFFRKSWTWNKNENNDDKMKKKVRHM
jgi:hypothetical protein